MLRNRNNNQPTRRAASGTTKKDKKRRTAQRTETLARSQQHKAVKDGLAALAGGAGGALIGGLLVKSGVKPTTAAIGVTVAGGVGAFTMKGHTRFAASGMAAAGAGQLALGWLAKVRQGLPEGQTLPPEILFEEPPQLGIGDAFREARNSYLDEYDDEELEIVLDAA